MLHRHERRELRENRPRHRGEVALALQQARELREVGLQPVLRGVLLGRVAQVDDHFVDVVLEGRHFAGRFDVDRLREVALRHGGRDFRDRAHLRGEVGGEPIDVVGQVLPRAGDAAHVGLAAELTFGADFLRDARHFGGERAELVHHGVDGVLQLENLAAGVDGDLLRQVAAGDGGRDVGDVAHLVGQVAGHRVDVVGQVLPGAADAGHVGLAAQLPLRADFARHARHFRRERAQLIHHRVDGVLELENLAAHRDRDLLREVALRDRGRDVRDVSDLAGQVAGHRVDRVGEVAPRAGNAAHVGLATELAFRADFARHARHFRRERVQLVGHRVDDVLDLQDFALRLHRDLLVQVAARDRGRDLRHVAQLHRQVAGELVDVVGEVLPRAGDAAHVGLAAQLAFGADFLRDARHFRRERRQLIDHRVDGVLQLENLAAGVDRDLLGQVTARDGGRHVGDVAHLVGQVAGHRVDVVGEVFPGAGDAADLGLAAELAFGAHFLRDARHFRRERAQLVHHRVDDVLDLQDLAARLHGDLLVEVAAGDRGRDLRHVAQLHRQVRGQLVDVVRQVLPRAGDAAHVGLAAELTFGADFLGDARDFRGERRQLVHHRVDGVLELEDFALDVDGDLPREVALGDGGRDVGDVAHLRRQVAGHRVDVVGQVLPRAGDAAHVGLAAELAVGADFLRDARHFRCE